MPVLQLWNMNTRANSLKRQVGLFGAVMLGLGSIVGTGVFVSLGLAAGITGPSVILATALAAAVATANAFSSAQLAASHPVSGGTYEYGYTYLTPALGFTAGWMFMCAKSASAATAALGFAGYLLTFTGLDLSPQVPLALGTVILITVIVLCGIRRSNQINTIIVSITLGALVLFCIGAVIFVQKPELAFRPFLTGEPPVRSFLEATALMFVAYTGYGRIATLGEEVREPRRIIPRAIVITLVVSGLLYVGVCVAAITSSSAELLAVATEETGAPLELIATQYMSPDTGQLIAIGAMTAMLGVLLNLVLGLSRVLLAMGRRRDVPHTLARVHAGSGTPVAAVVVVAVVICALALSGSIRLTWSFSAFTVLIYYAITNLAALQLKPEARLYPRVFPVFGLSACLFLAFWIEPRIWLTGLGLIVAGLIWHGVARSRRAT